MQKKAFKAYRPHLAIFRTVNGRGGFRWPSRANNEAPARPQNGQKERSEKKCTLPRTEACSPNISSRFSEVQAEAFSTILTSSLHVTSSLHEADLLHKQLRKKETCSPHKQTAGPKRKTSQILDKEICIAPEHLSS